MARVEVVAAKSASACVTNLRTLFDTVRSESKRR